MSPPEKTKCVAQGFQLSKLVAKKTWGWFASKVFLCWSARCREALTCNTFETLLLFRNCGWLVNGESKDYLKHLKQQHDNMKEDFPLFHWKMDTPLKSTMQPQKWIWKMFSSLEMAFGVPCSIPVIPIFLKFQGITRAPQNFMVHHPLPH